MNISTKCQFPVFWQITCRWETVFKSQMTNMIPVNQGRAMLLSKEPGLPRPHK